MAQRPQAGLSTVGRCVLQLRGSQWRALSKVEQEAMVEMCFRYWRRRGFPYYSLSDDDIVDDYTQLELVDSHRILLGREIQMSMVGLRLANFFHPQMWEVPVRRARTPVERFHDDEKLRKLIRKALTIWPDRFAVNDSNLRRMLKTFSRTAGVSNFRPTAAKAIYDRYSGNGDTVLDFSAGYGGRMLGCLPLNRQYIGVDPCAAQVGGLKRMLTKLKKLVRLRASAEIIMGCAEEVLPTIRAGSVSLVFSSPPYFDHEKYSTEPSQSYVRYPQYSQWLQEFVQRVIVESRRILKPGGFLVLNVADVQGYSLTKDVKGLCSRRFTAREHLRLLLGCKPYRRTRSGAAYKREPVLVFQKERSAG